LEEEANNLFGTSRYLTSMFRYSAIRYKVSKEGCLSLVHQIGTVVGVTHMDSLKTNGTFLDAFTNATAYSVRTHEQEKIEAFKVNLR
jgi:hypothetical protein